MPYSMEFAFQKFMRSVKGLLEVQYECIYLTSCIQNFSPIIYYCDQLSWAVQAPKIVLFIVFLQVFFVLQCNRNTADNE